MKQPAVVFEKEIRPAGMLLDLRWEPDAIGPGIHATVGSTPSGAWLLKNIQFDSGRFTRDSAVNWLELHTRG